MNPPVMVPYEFDIATIRLVVRGLGKLPHEEVDATINRIVDHANAVLNPPPVVKPKRKKKEPVPPAQG